MKTTINRDTTAFQPISVTFKIETIEELKQVLIMASALSDTDALDDNHLGSSGIRLDAFPGQLTFANADSIVKTIGNIIPDDVWEELNQIHANYFQSQG